MSDEPIKLAEGMWEPPRQGGLIENHVCEFA